MKRILAIIGSILCIFITIFCFSSIKQTSFNHIQISNALQATTTPSSITENRSDVQKTTSNNSIEYTIEGSIPPNNDMTDLGLTSNMTYVMSLYTEAQNQNSSFKIQYPFFIWDRKNKAVEINRLILNKMREIAEIDPGNFPENPKVIANFQSSVTLLNSKIVSIVFWGDIDIEVSQFPTTNLYALNIDLENLKEIQLPDLYTTNEKFEEVFFEKAFFPKNPITSSSEEQFSEMLKYQTSEYQSISPFKFSEDLKFFLKPEGIVFSLPSVHANGYDHFEAELLYSDIQEFYLPEQIYWE